MLWLPWYSMMVLADKCWESFTTVGKKYGSKYSGWICNNSTDYNTVIFVDIKIVQWSEYTFLKH